MAQPGAWIQQVTGTSLPDAQQKEQWIQNYMAQNRVPRWMAENAWYQQLSPEQQRAVREEWHREINETRAERTAAILDLLMRGEYASAGAAESILSGDILGAPGAFWRGLTGQERITYSDIMHERLPEGLPDWAKSGLGFVAGVLLDPTTYLGVGGLTKAGQAARVTGDLAPTLAGRIAAGQQGIVTFAGRTVAPQLQSKVVQALEPLSRRVADSAVVQELVKMFSTKPLGPAAKVEEIIRNKEQVARYLIDRARRQNVELSAVVSELEKQMGLPPGTLERHITREVERMRPATMLRAIRREVKETVPVTETVMRQVEAIRERPRPNPEWYELMQEPVPERLTEQEVIRAITDELAWMRGELEQATVEPGGISRAPDPYHPDVTGSGDVVFRWGTVSTTPPWFRELGRSREEVLQAFERKEGALFERLVEIASRRVQEGYVDWISGTEIPPRFIPERVRETIEVPEQVTRMVERTRQVVEPVEVPWQLTMEYEIQRGDTLSALAKRFNTTVDELLALNPQIRNPDYIRAGDTIRVPNTEAKAASGTLRPTHGTARPLPEIDVSKPLYEMTGEELDRLAEAVKQYEDNVLIHLFGEEGAKRYKKLQRRANSAYVSYEEARKAADELLEMEERLTPEQQRLLYGQEDPVPELELVQEFRSAVLAVESAATPEELGHELAFAIRRLSNVTDIERALPQEQIAYAQLRRAYEIIQERGWDPQVVSRAAIERAASFFRDPADAAYVLERYLRRPEQRAAAASMQPETTTAGQRRRGPAWPGLTTQLSEHVPIVYRETSIKHALKAIPGSGVEQEARELFFASVPELATGQGRNRGVLMEFDADKLVGRIDATKPTWEAAYDQGWIEFIVYPQHSDLPAGLRRITVLPDAPATAAEREQLESVLRRLEQQGWVRQVEPDGRISWTRPDVAGVRNVAPTAAASEVPEPQLTPGDRIRVPAPEAVTPIIERIRAEQPARLEREWAAGLPTARWVSEELEYFGRIATPEFEEYLRRNRREFARRERLDIRHASQRPRRLPDLPIEELNRANREGRLGYNRETGEYFVSERTLPRKEQAFPGYNGDLFETDPFVIEYVREARSIRAIKAAEALDEIRELGLREGWIREAPGQLTIEGKVVVDPREIPEGWELLQTPAFGDKFAGLIVRSDIAKHIRGWYEKATNQEQLSWFWKTFDAVQNWWKAMTLSPFPSYHARNLAGNLWNNYLADVAPRYYADAAAALMGRKGSLKIRSGPLAGQSIPYNEVMELAAMHGAIDTGFFAAEFGAARLRDVDQIRLVQAQQAFVRGDWREALRRYRQSVTPRQFILREINPFHPQGLLVRGGRAIGQAIENHARLAHFMDRLARGFTPEQAVASVKTFLFDYRDVTRFEADVMRRLMPFYSWTRKNIPRQILSTAERPGKVVTPLKAERELQRLRGEDMPDPEEIPDWIRESFPVYLGRTEEGEDRWWTALRWWPWAEVFEPIEDPVGWAGGMLTPFLRVPIELATNFDLYFREPIVPPELYAAGETRLRNFLGRPMAAETAHVLGQIRLLSELDRLNPWNVFGEERPYRQDPEQAARWVRFLTGMNIYETDPMMTAIYRRLAELEAIEALRREARRAAREGDEEGREFILQRIRQRLGR